MGFSILTPPHLSLMKYSDLCTIIIQPFGGVEPPHLVKKPAAGTTHTSIAGSWEAKASVHVVPGCVAGLVGTVRWRLQTLAFPPAGLLLPYPTANLVLDVVMLFLYLGVEVIRLFFGKFCPENISIPYETCWSL